MEKPEKRAVLKNGECNVLQKNVSRGIAMIMQDCYTTIVDGKWIWMLVSFALIYAASWFLFAIFYYLVIITNKTPEGKMIEEEGPRQTYAPCFENVNTFMTAVMFSLETQQTIGYGYRAVTDACVSTIVLVGFQSIYSLVLNTFLAGIVFAKLTRGRRQLQALLFSKKAVVCTRDGVLALMFRIGDMRNSNIIGAMVRAQFIQTRTTAEGETMSQHFTALEVGYDECGPNVFLLWPMVVVHKIDDKSPMYTTTPADLLDNNFEIVVMLEGTVETTGQPTEARTSYLSTEILWGYRFDPVVKFNRHLKAYEIDYSFFDDTSKVSTPVATAREVALAKMRLWPI